MFVGNSKGPGARQQFCSDTGFKMACLLMANETPQKKAHHHPTHSESAQLMVVPGQHPVHGHSWLKETASSCEKLKALNKDLEESFDLMIKCQLTS